MYSHVINIKKLIMLGAVGNALEFYDLALYAVFSSQIVKVYFPVHDDKMLMLSVWASFACGFVMRPLGGIIFGYLGDKYGRKNVLTLTLFLMAVPTFIIGIMPGYSKIGYIAPILLVVARLIQGLCTGGEHNGAAIYVLECISKSQHGVIGGIISGSCFVGTTLAAIAGVICSHLSSNWCWRLPFLLGTVISLLGYNIRKRYNESIPYLKCLKIQNVMPLKAAIKKYKKQCLIIFLIASLDGVMCYFLIGFMPVYLNRYLHFPAHKAFEYNLAGLFVAMIFAPIFGKISDIFTPKNTLVASIIIIIISAFPIFYMLQQGTTMWVILAEILSGFSVAAILGPEHSFFQEQFPVAERFSGIAFSYCLGISIFGALTPLLISMLVEIFQNLYMPVFYIFMLSLFPLFALINMKNHNKISNLDKLEQPG